MITLFTSHFAYITIDSQHVTKSGQSAKGAHRSQKKQQLEAIAKPLQNAIYSFCCKKLCRQ